MYNYWKFRTAKKHRSTVPWLAQAVVLALAGLASHGALAQDDFEDPFKTGLEPALKIAPKPLSIKEGPEKPRGLSTMEMRQLEATEIKQSDPNSFNPQAPTGRQRVLKSIADKKSGGTGQLAPLPGAPIPATGADLERAVAEIGAVKSSQPHSNQPGSPSTPLRSNEPGITASNSRTVLPTPRKAPGLEKNDLIKSSVGERLNNEKNFSGSKDNRNALVITRSGNQVRGIQSISDDPAVQTLQMTPAENGRGGTVTSFTLTPTFPVAILMPFAIENIITGSALINAEKDASSPNLIVVKTTGNPENPVPIGLHLRDVNGRLYTFKVLMKPLDLSQENPQTIVIEYKPYSNVDLSNDDELLDVLKTTQRVDDIIPMIVGSLPSTGDFAVELDDVQYQSNIDVTVFPLRINKRDKKNFNMSKMKVTVFIDGKPVKASGSNDLEGAPQKVVIRRLSASAKQATDIAGYQVEKIALIVKAPQLKSEEWESVFFLIADEDGYTRTIDFGPRMREFRAPVK